MKEKIIKFKKGPFPKKYTAHVKDKKTKKVRKIHFGDVRYQQYKDRTPLKLYANKNHGTRKISFGALGYQQFKDRTPLKLYKKLNHSDKKRQERYYARFSQGIKNRKKAIIHEQDKSNGIYNSKILSHIYLW